MNKSIPSQWVKASYRWGRGPERIEYTLTIQRLGLLDEDLHAEELRIASLSEKDLAYEHEIKAFNNLHTFSWLWILGCYEFVRSLCQDLEDDSSHCSSRFLMELTEFKDEIAEIRMPLAKFESRRERGKPTTRLVAWPVRSMSGEIGWTVDGASFVTRRHFAEKLLRILLSPDTTDQ